MEANFLTFVSSRLSEVSILAAFEGYLAHMQATYPGQFDAAFLVMSYIQKYAGGHVMFSDTRLVNALLGYDFAGVRKLHEPILRAELDIPTIIATMEAEFITRSDQFKRDLAANGMKQELLLAREEEWRSGALSVEMSILVAEEEVITHNLELMEYYLTMDVMALEAKMRLNNGSESKEDLNLIAIAETERIVPINVIIHLPDFQTISFTRSRVKQFNTDTVYSRPAPSWITDSQVHAAFNRLLLSGKDRLYRVGNTQVKSPLVQRKSYGNDVVFRVQFLGDTPARDLSYAMLTSTPVTFDRYNGNIANVKFEPTGSNKFGGEQIWNQPPNRQRRR